MFLIYSILNAVMILCKVVTYSSGWWVFILCVVSSSIDHLYITAFSTTHTHSEHAELLENFGNNCRV